MAKFNPTQITSAGLVAVADVFQHQELNKISRISISSKNYSTETHDTLKRLTILEDEVLSVPPSEIKKYGNQYSFYGVFDSRKILTDTYVYTIGIYVKDRNNNEVLLALVPATVPDFIPKFGGSVLGGSIKYGITLSFSDGTGSANFSVTIDDSALAQMKDIAETREYANQLVSEEDKKVVHNTGDELIAGRKSFSEIILGSISGNAGTANYVRGVNIATGTNFSGLKSSGRYISDGTVSNLLGIPAGVGNRKFQVDQYVWGETGFRTLSDDVSNLYYATMSNGVWSAWHKLLADDLQNEFTQDTTFDKSIRVKSTVSTSGLELSHATTPFIDFHNKNSTLDWTTRLLEPEPGTLEVQKTDSSKGILRANLVGNADTATKADRLSRPFKIDNVPTDGTGEIFTNGIYRGTLTGNTDLNTITRPGIYSVQNVMHSNNPFGGNAINGVLAVRAIDDIGTRYWAHQTFFQNNADIWFNDPGAVDAPNWKRTKNAKDTTKEIEDAAQWINLIPNSDFASNAYGWNLNNSNGKTSIATDGMTLTVLGPDQELFRHALINDASPSPTTNWGGASQNGLIDVIPGKEYWYSAWVYSVGENGQTPPKGQIGFNFYLADGKTWLTDKYERLDFVNMPSDGWYNQWHRVTKKFVVPNDVYFLKMIFFSRQGARELMAEPMLVRSNSRADPTRYVPGEPPFDKMMNFFDITAGNAQDIESINRFKNNVGFYGGTSFWSKPIFNGGLSVLQGDMETNGKFRGSAIELTLNTPFIDFHFDSDTANDFTTRLIEQEKGKLSLFQGVPFGKGTLIANLEGNASTASKLSGQIHKGTFTLNGLTINYLWGNGTVTFSLFSTLGVNLDGAKNLGKIPSGIPIPETTVTAAGFLAGINIFHFNVNQYGDFYTNFFGDTTNKYVRGSLSYPYDMMKYS